MAPRRPKKGTAEEIVAGDSSYFVTQGGLGTTVDKAIPSSFCASPPGIDYLQALYEGNGLFARAVSKIVKDALRNGFEVRFDSDTDAEDATELQSQLREWMEEYDMVSILKRHLTQSQLFGGSVLMQVTGNDQSTPKLGPQRATPRYLTFAPHEITAGDIERDPLVVGYGLPEYWLIRGKTRSVRIDSTWTRPTISESVVTDPIFRSRNSTGREWAGPSFGQKFLSEAERFGIVTQSSASASQVLYQFVYKIAGFISAAGNVDGKAAMRTRLSAIEAKRSMLQPIALDTSEELSVLQTSVAGLGDIIDRLMVAMAAAADMPVTVLFGVSPGGFGTGEAELRSWQDEVRFYQRTVLRPILRWCVAEFFEGMGVKKKWDIQFMPLQSPTASEQADLENKQAQTDAIYLDRQVLLPDEVAMSRYGGGEWSAHTSLDMEMRERIEEEMEQELANNVPTEEDPTEANGQQGNEPGAEPSDDGRGSDDD